MNNEQIDGVQGKRFLSIFRSTEKIQTYELRHEKKMHFFFCILNSINMESRLKL